MRMMGGDCKKLQEINKAADDEVGFSCLYLMRCWKNYCMFSGLIHFIVRNNKFVITHKTAMIKPFFACTSDESF